MFFHISPHFTDDTTTLFHLKVPSCRAHGEDDTTPRVCVAPTLEGCWMGKDGLMHVSYRPAYDFNWYIGMVHGIDHLWKDHNQELIEEKLGTMLNVWVYVGDTVPRRPSIEELPDVNVTNEHWVIGHPVFLKLGKVVIDEGCELSVVTRTPEGNLFTFTSEGFQEYAKEMVAQWKESQ